MKAPQQFETARLVFAVPVLTDAEAIYERYAGDAAVTRFLAWPRHQTVSDTRAFLEFSAAEWARGPAGPYLIRSRADGRVLGGTGLSFDEPRQAMTGYVLARDAWGQGLATEALAAMVELAASLSVERIYAMCHPEHRASIRVLEKGQFRKDDAWNGRATFPNLGTDTPQDVLRYERFLLDVVGREPGR